MKESHHRILINTSTALLFLISGCKPSISVPTVDIPGRLTTGGRSLKDVEDAYRECQEIATRTNQEGICNPKDEVFGDVPEWGEYISGMKVMIFEYPNIKGALPKQTTFSEAETLCQDLGGRLPTDREWESLARGKTNQTWPWGNEPPDETRANIDLVGGNPHRSLVPSGSFPKGATFEGIQDLIGNVWEWVKDHITGNPERKGGGSGTIGPFSQPVQNISGGDNNTLAGFRCVFPLQ